MLQFTTHNYPFLTRNEVWFFNGEEIKNGAYTMFSAAKKVIDLNVLNLQKYTTSIIDLSKSEEELFNAIHPRIRRYIRAAEKQGIKVRQKLEPSFSDCEYALTCFNKFARGKNISALSKKWLDSLIKKEIYVLPKPI